MAEFTVDWIGNEENQVGYEVTFVKRRERSVLRSLECPNIRLDVAQHASGDWVTTIEYPDGHTATSLRGAKLISATLEPLQEGSVSARIVLNMGILVISLHNRSTPVYSDDIIVYWL